MFQFRSKQLTYKCLGEFVQQPERATVRLVVELHEYRWGVDLLGPSIGNLSVAIDGRVNDYYRHVSRADNFLSFRNDQHELAGHFSMETDRLALKTHAGVFEGTCRPLGKKS